MKRAAVLGFLALCVGGVVFLLLETSRERVERRGGLDAHEAERQDAQGETAAGEPGATESTATDDDPNRIPGPDHRIFGRVLRDRTGVAGATVTIYRARPWNGGQLPDTVPAIATVKTDDAGRFSLTIPRRRSATVHASAPGSGFRRLLMFLPQDGDPEELIINLGAGHTLVGRVITHDDKPVAKAKIRLRHSNWRTPPFDQEGETDAEGEFTFTNLASGSYDVQVTATGLPVVTRRAQVPNQTHVRLVLRPGGTVFGTVKTAAGAPVANAEVKITTREELSGQQSLATVTTGSDGAYRAPNLTPGIVSSASVKSPAVGTQRGFAMPRELLESGKELKFDIELKPGAPVTGRAVLKSTGAPVAGARVALLRMSGQYRNFTDAASATTKEDGSFEFPFVIEGTYALEATAPGAARRVMRYASGQRPLTIDFYADGEKSPPEQKLELVPTGDVRGKVTGIAPALLNRLGINLTGTDIPVQAQTDDTGVFLFANVLPAPQVIAQSWNPPLKSEPFEIKAGETAEIELDAGKQADFIGVVVDDEGQPIEGASVQAVPESQAKGQLRGFLQGNTWQASKTDPDGRYHHSVQQWYRQSYGGQKYLLAAFHPDYLTAVVTGVKLPREGESVETKLTLSRGATITGRVQFADGTPAPSLPVYAGPKAEKGAPYETRARRTTYTDFDGRFTFDAIGDGLYTISTYYAAGTAPAQEGMAGATGIELVIEPREAIRGVVVDEEGQPVTQGRIYAIVPMQGGKERKHWGQLSGGGRFVIRNLEPGAYAIEFTANTGQWGVTPQYEDKRIPPVAVGTEDVVIELSPGAVVEGKVLDPDGRPVAGAGVIAMPITLDPKQRNNAWNISRPAAVTNGRGEFKIKGAGDKEVELLAISTGYVFATARAVPGGAAATLRLRRGAVIEVTMLRPDGKPLSGQWLNVQAVSPELQKKYNDLWQRAGQSYNTLGGWNMLGVMTDSRGRAKWRALLEGEYQLSIYTDVGSLPPTKLTTGSGMRTIRMEPALEIRGRVTNTAGEPIATRVWVNARDSNNTSRGASAGPDGYFRITGLAAGPVTITTYANGYAAQKLTSTAGDHNVIIQIEKR